MDIALETSWSAKTCLQTESSSLESTAIGIGVQEISILMKLSAYSTPFLERLCIKILPRHLTKFYRTARFESCHFNKRTLRTVVLSVGFWFKMLVKSWITFRRTIWDLSLARSMITLKYSFPNSCIFELSCWQLLKNCYSMSKAPSRAITLESWALS